MEPLTLYALLTTALFIGTIHTVLGPDHYLPFIVLSRVRGWSLSRTVAWTLVCGVGHVASSALLGLAGVALGVAVGGLETLESMRGDIASWAMLGFGIAYGSWGLRRALQGRGEAHSHPHVHADGTLHEHHHDHRELHAHPHVAPQERRSVTPWVLFIIFALGPCEPLIPILIYPAAQHSLFGVLAVAGVFALATLLTMTTMVLLGRSGLRLLPTLTIERYAHALAGLALAVCGLSMQWL
jgi:sulfite exporter TauE/SafE